jgi:hypothetical protein
VAALAAVPVVFLVSTWSTWGTVSASLIIDHPWPHRLAAIALVLLVLGVARAERRPAVAARGGLRPGRWPRRGGDRSGKLGADD